MSLTGNASPINSISYTTILTFDGNTFDANQLGNATAVYANGAYSLYYSGLSFSNRKELGLATSLDLDSFTRLSNDPIVSAAEEPWFASFRILPATVIFEDSIYKMWLSGINSNLRSDFGQTTGWGYGTSTDGISWNFETDPIRSGTGSFQGDLLIEVVKLGDIYLSYYMHMDGTRGGLQNKHYVAYSDDGVNFSGEIEFDAPSGPEMLAATSAGDIVISIWTENDQFYTAYSENGVDFIKHSSFNLPFSGGPLDLTVEGDMVVLWCVKNEGPGSWGGGTSSLGQFILPLDEFLPPKVINAPPEISSSSEISGSVAENGLTVDSGAMVATDEDIGSILTWSIISGGLGSYYGSFAISVEGIWTYSLDVAASQNLRQGEIVYETFIVSVFDEFGSFDNETITISIAGENDIPEISESSMVSGNSAEGGEATISGAMLATDVDKNAFLFWTTPVGGADSAYGSFAIDGDGIWTYSQDASAVSGLDLGEIVVESFSVSVTDEYGGVDVGTVSITISGTLDAAILVSDGNGDGRVTGGNNSDTMSGGNGNDTLIGGAGNDFLSGDNGTDELFGVSGNDFLRGGSGRDTLHGGSGDDTMIGGSGIDHFVFIGSESYGDQDVITDFQLNDRIYFSDFGPLNFGKLAVSQSGINTTLYVHSYTGDGNLIEGSEMSIILLGVSAASITQTSFMFG